MSVLGSDPDVPVSELLFELPIQEMLYELNEALMNFLGILASCLSSFYNS